MSARDVLAEAVWRAGWSSHSPWSEADDAERVDVFEVTDALLAAIRGMSAQQQAELIGGKVLNPYGKHERVLGPWHEVQP